MTASGLLDRSMLPFTNQNESIALAQEMCVSQRGGTGDFLLCQIVEVIHQETRIALFEFCQCVRCVWSC